MCLPRLKFVNSFNNLNTGKINYFQFDLRKKFNGNGNSLLYSYLKQFKIINIKKMQRKNKWVLMINYLNRIGFMINMRKNYHTNLETT